MNYKENKDKVDIHNNGERNHDIITDIRNYWYMLKRHWLPAIATFSFTLAMSSIYASTKVPVYRAQGQLLFKSNTASSLIGLKSADQSNEGYGWLDADRVLDTQIRVLLSEPILKQVVEAVNQNKNIPGLPLNVQSLAAELSIKNAVGTNVLQISYQSTSGEVAALVVNELINVYLRSNLIDSRSTATAARQFIAEQLPKVRKNVVSADTALRSFKEKYNITDLATTKSALATNKERIQSEIDENETELANLNSQSLDIQKKLGMNTQEAITISNLGQSPGVQGLLENLQEIQAKLAEAKARYQPEHPTLVNLQEKEVQARTLLQAQIVKVLPKQKANVVSKYQIGISQSAVMTAQQSLIIDLLKAEISRIGTANKLAKLIKQKDFYQKQAAILPGLEQQQRELERNLTAAESTYETLLKSLQEVRLKENQTIGNVRVIESAVVPGTPLASSKTSTIVAGTLGGILLAGAVIYILEARNKKLKTVQQVRELFEYKLLGTIPVFNKITRNDNSDKQTSNSTKLQLPVIEKLRCVVSESYRMLQSNLKSLNVDNSLKVLVVTSSVPKEGKSTTCANLAASMAQLGQKILIVDADLHRSTQHELWKISNAQGLSNILAEPTTLRRNFFHRVMENLDVITSGALPANPLALIDSKYMANFLKECSRNYDYIFIDTPPLAFAADAVTLGRIADGVLIVTRPGVADSSSARLAKEYLDQSGSNVLGIVVNGVLPENGYQSSLLHYYAPN